MSAAQDAIFFAALHDPMIAVEGNLADAYCETRILRIQVWTAIAREAALGLAWDGVQEALNDLSYFLP